MIERHWKGVARPEEAQNYIGHLQTKTFPHMAKMSGFLKATILKRPADKGVEFLIVSAWDNIESVRQFAGEQVEVANVPREAQEMMVEFDLFAVHYEVAGEVAAP
jgi:heme-degrading monooxygenase HmoA